MKQKAIKVIYRGKPIYLRDVELIRKIQKCGVFTPDEVEYLEMSLMRLNRIENEQLNVSIIKEKESG